MSIQTDVPGLGSNALQLLSIYQSNPLNPNDEGPVLQQKMGILVVASDLASKAGDDVSYQRICAQIGAAKEFVKRRVAISSTSSPTLTFPETSVPVTTVPTPLL